MDIVLIGGYKVEACDKDVLPQEVDIFLVGARVNQHGIAFLCGLNRFLDRTVFLRHRKDMNVALVVIVSAYIGSGTIAVFGVIGVAGIHAGAVLSQVEVAVIRIDPEWIRVDVAFTAISVFDVGVSNRHTSRHVERVIAPEDGARDLRSGSAAECSHASIAKIGLIATDGQVYQSGVCALCTV